MMTIAIHAVVYRFQKRAWWQLSSLAEQRGTSDYDVPRFVYHVSTVSTDPYADEFQRATSCFPFEIRHHCWSESEFTQRGLIRTQNLRQETEEFLLFVDADMVYHPTFFARLVPSLHMMRDAGDHRVWSVPRLTMSPDDGYRLSEQAHFDAPIRDAWNQAASVPSKRWSYHGRISGAGYFQLIHVPSVRDYMRRVHGDVYYVRPHSHHDTHIITGSTYVTRSDRVFRINVGGVVPIRELGDSIHINHWRRHDPQWNPNFQH